MSYSYYQQAQPGWGTNQYQFGPPPTPNFQSQPSWGGLDFYRAHALSPDPSLFDHAWNRVRDFTGIGGMDRIGVGLHEARHWHRRAYGGVGELSMMLPAEIGHAAAYEAFRTWIHNSSIYEPLSGDVGRQREGLIGLAVAEATRLLSYAGRQMDNYARREASEAAAETASVLFHQNRDGMMGEEYRSRSHYGGSTYGGDPYAYDDVLSYPRRRSRSRHGRSHSRHRSQPIIIQGGGAYPSPMPGSFPSGGYAGSMPPGVAASYSGQSGSYGSYGERVPMPIHGTPYPASAGSVGMGMGGYQGPPIPNVVPMDGFQRGRSASMSYSQAPYMGSAMSSSGMMMPGAPQPQTIVVTTPHRKHKHHHHRSRGRRSRSSDRYDYRY